MQQVVDFMQSFDETIFEGLVSRQSWMPKMVFDNGEEFNLLYPNSPVCSSTMFGYAIEAYITKCLLNKVSDVATNKTPYDVLYDFDDYKVMINIKAQKGDSNESGIAAYSSLLTEMRSALVEKPTYYFVYEVEYKLDEEGGEVRFTDHSYYCLNNYLTQEQIKTDGRSWGAKPKKKKNEEWHSGRILRNQKVVYKYDDIPSPEETYIAVERLLSYKKEQVQELSSMMKEYNRK